MRPACQRPEFSPSDRSMTSPCKTPSYWFSRGGKGKAQLRSRSPLSGRAGMIARPSIVVVADVRLTGVDLAEKDGLEPPGK